MKQFCCCTVDEHLSFLNFSSGIMKILVRNAIQGIFNMRLQYRISISSNLRRSFNPRVQVFLLRIGKLTEQDIYSYSSVPPNLIQFTDSTSSVPAFPSNIDKVLQQPCFQHCFMLTPSSLEDQRSSTISHVSNKSALRLIYCILVELFCWQPLRASVIIIKVFRPTTRVKGSTQNSLFIIYMRLSIFFGSRLPHGSNYI